MKRAKPVLDYSSPAEEQRRERTAEDERREALERYNEATFGERRPIASAFLKFAVLFAIGAVAMWVLPVPRWSAGLVALLLLVAFAVWEARR